MTLPVCSSPGCLALPHADAWWQAKLVASHARVVNLSSVTHRCFEVPADPEAFLHSHSSFLYPQTKVAQVRLRGWVGGSGRVQVAQVQRVVQVCRLAQHSAPLLLATVGAGREVAPAMAANCQSSCSAVITVFSRT